MKMRKTAVLCLLVIFLHHTTNAQSQEVHSPLEMDSILKQGPEYDLIILLVGTWKVQQTIFYKDSHQVMARDTFKVERKWLVISCRR